MKAVITGVDFLKEWEGKWGKMYDFKVSYDGRSALYSSKSKEQNKFVKGQEAEFTEMEQTTNKGSKYIKIKPVYDGPQQRRSNYGKNLKSEQSRYSGFAVSYAKDLCVAGKIELDELMDFSSLLFHHMVELDKTLDQ